MARGLFYSFLALLVFAVAVLLWMYRTQPDQEEMYLMSGWILLMGFFAVGPFGFVLGFWHHRRLHPSDPKWDTETGE